MKCFTAGRIELALLLSLVLMTGCSRRTEETTGGNDTKPRAAAPRAGSPAAEDVWSLDEWDGAAELPELADSLPPLDGRRIEVAPPAGWQVPPRSSKWIVRFKQHADSSYPTILLTAVDYPDVPDVSAEADLKKFATLVAEAEKVPEARPVEIGQFVGVAYRKRGKEPGTISSVVERFFLSTVVAGRKYTLELQTREGTLSTTRPSLMAVAKGIKFLDADAPGQPAEPKDAISGADPGEPVAEPQQPTE